MHMWRHIQWTGTNSQPLDRTIPSPVILRECDIGAARPNKIAARITHVVPRSHRTLRRKAEKRLAGDHAQVETPVPIPNTADKHLGPMIVRPARK